LRTELRYAVVAVVLTAGCNQPVQELKRVVRVARRTGPQIPATVVTLRTTLQPANKATTTTIVIADEFARSTDEVGEWRLFDLKENRVAFVNDFAKTYRYESLESLRDRHDDASSEPVSEKIPRPEYSVTAESREILGVPAKRSVVKLGGYRREIWFGSHPLIPKQLFALMQASRQPGPDAPVSKRVDDALLAVRGFPLADHAELPYAQTKIVVDRNVVSIERKNVAASLLDIPDTYSEVKAGSRPAPKPRPVVAPPTATALVVAPTTTVSTTTVAPVTATVPAEARTHTETMGPPKPPAGEKKKPAVTKKAPTKKAPTKKAPAKKAPAKTKKSSTKKSS
jgi:hypothetical protein